MTKSLGFGSAEMVRLQEQLRLAEQRLRESQRLARIGSWELDLISNSLFWSDEVFHIFEISPDTFEGTFDAFLALVHPEDREALNNAYQSSLSDRTKYQIQHRVLFPDGRTMYVEERCEHIYDEHGRAIRSIGTVQDITEKFLYEEQLREKNAALEFSKRELQAKDDRFEQVAKSTQTVIWEVDAQGLYTFVSPLAEKIWLYKPEEIVQKYHFYDMHPEEGRSEFKEAVMKVFESGAVITDLVNDVVRGDGSLVTVITNGQPIFDEKGSLCGYRGSDQDITDRLRAEAQLRQSHEMLHKLSMSVPGVLYQFLLTPDGRTSFPYASPQGEHVYEITREEVKHDASAIFAKIHPDDVAWVLAAIKRSSESLSIFQAEYRIQLTGRPDQWFFATAMPERLADGSTLWHGISFNIDDRKQLESTLRQNEKELRTLLEIREEQHKRLINFTHIVSHNLRSHTANLQGLMSIMEMDTPEMYDHEYVQMVARSTALLSDTIDHLNKVLDIRLNTDHLMEIVNLSELAENLRPSMLHLSGQQAVRLDFDVPAGITVRGVKSYLENVLLSLVSNAVNFRSSHRQATVKLTISSEVDRVLIAVSDNGLGMNLNRIAPKLFGMYKTFHADESKKGLGLFIVKNQVDAMGGQIEVESQPDQGSVFTVTLPTL